MSLDTTVLAAVGAKLGYDVFGTSAKYLGDELKKLTKVGVKNIQRVAKKAKQRKTELGIEGGAVAPRVLPLLLENAYYCEDELVASYLGGVMCSALSPHGRDDRGIAFVKTIEGLSSYALRAHCIVYASVANQPKTRMTGIQKWLARGHGVTVVFDDREFCDKMGFAPEEDAEALLEHAFLSLSAGELCMQGIHPVILHKTKQKVRAVHLTPRGVELFCWGNGFGQTGPERYFSGQAPSVESSALAVVPVDLQLGMVSFA
jgi:hypothetical protein